MKSRIYRQPSHFECERAKMLETEILARAIFRQPDGTMTVIAVFSGSTEHEFYWTFRATSETAPVSDWKLTNWSPRTHGAYYSDWGSFLDAHAQRFRHQHLLKTWHDPRRLAAMIRSGLRSSLHTRVDDRPDEQISTEKVERKMALGRNPRAMVGSLR